MTALEATEPHATMADVKRILAEMSAADVASVVRCKDCKHSYDDPGGLTCSHGVCVDCIVPPDFYCSYGKRKEKPND